MTAQQRRGLSFSTPEVLHLPPQCSVRRCPGRVVNARWCQFGFLGIISDQVGERTCEKCNMAVLDEHRTLILLQHL
ncbi:hypothetical protein AGIG_G5335 [Arapaima gigas]